MIDLSQLDFIKVDEGEVKDYVVKDMALKFCYYLKNTVRNSGDIRNKIADYLLNLIERDIKQS